MSPTVRAFGKYLLDEEIARGGMSRVFSARLRGLGGFEKRLVVKQVLPELASDPRFVTMFVDEAKTLVQMSHPHIAPVYELGVIDGVYFLAMEYVDGATLSAMLKDGPLAPELVAHVGAEVCDALHYAHSRFGIVHRDVTPRNVIVDGGGHTRLIDFGIAAPLEGSTKEVFGTPGYLSPEQLDGGALGPASDVFSLGAVLFEALTGRRAFAGRTVEETRAALEGELPSLEDDGVPDGLAALVSRALARDPSDRFGSARELGRALRSWLASAHPEGVAPELGLRVEQAEREETAHVPIDDASGSATGEVRTLATSRVLDEILEASPGTVQIEGRRSTPEVVPASPAPRSSRWPLIAVPLVALGFVGLAMMAANEEVERPQPRIEARSEVRPRTPHVEPPEPEPEQEEPIEIAPPPEPEPAVRSVALSVNASPWAEVVLDGREVGRTPQRRLSVRPGRHTIVFRCPPLGREVRHTFDARGPTTLVADLTRDPPTVR